MPSIEGTVVKSRSIEGDVSQPIGITPNIQVNSTTTLEAGEPAFVELDESSTRSNPKFNFGIPKGNDYIITEADKEEIESNIRFDIQPILEEAKENSETAISISKGANQALSYLTYPDMIINFNAFDKNKFEKSQSVMIKQLNVPDMWIYDLSDEYVEYTYTTDEEVINSLMSDAGLHVGYYILGPLETQKVDLTEYPTFNDYATLTKAGVVKAGQNGVYIDGTGALYIGSATTNEIDKRLGNYKPIVPTNLDYAVKSVGDGYYTKFDDYAENAGKGGVVKVNQVYGLRMSSDHTLRTNLATNQEIDEKTNAYKPIVPSNLKYAVESVKASETQFGTIKAWTSNNEDGEVGLNISTEV